MKHLLKAAKFYLLERDLETKLQALKTQRRALRDSLGLPCNYSSEFRWHDGGSRQDLILTIHLGEYLTLCAPQDPKPTPHQYESDDLRYEGPPENQRPVIVGRGTMQFLTYPDHWVGSLPTTPPTHVWVRANTEPVWAVGSPKPLAEPIPEPQPLATPA